MTDPPEPAVNPELAERLGEILAWPILLGTMTAVLAFTLMSAVLVFALLKSAQLPHPALLVTSLSVLTLAAIIGYLVNSAAELLTLAGTGLGALAGAVSGLYTRDTPPPPDE